jgi:EAL domain-containing protein (putative c-di-GMP-specific phosphodiesterase class I)
VLHLTTVAEGIETDRQATGLVLLGCDTGQGYLFSKPQPAAELDDVMTASAWADRTLLPAGSRE